MQDFESPVRREAVYVPKATTLRDENGNSSFEESAVVGREQFGLATTDDSERSSNCSGDDTLNPKPRSAYPLVRERESYKESYRSRGYSAALKGVLESGDTLKKLPPVLVNNTPSPPVVYKENNNNNNFGGQMLRTRLVA